MAELTAAFVLGAVFGVLLGVAFCWDRPKSRVKFDGDYLLFDGPLTPDQCKHLREAWDQRATKVRSLQ